MLNDFNFNNKIVLIRVDFNVLLDKNLMVIDVMWIEVVKFIIIKVLEDGGSCVLMLYLGCLKNKENEFLLKYIVNIVIDIFGVVVKFVDDCVGDKVEDVVFKF